MPKSTLPIFLCLAILIPLVFFFCLMTGSSDIPLSDVLRALSGQDCPPEVKTVILGIRLPRSLAALVAGSAVSVCGLMMQTMFANPLAGPYVLGVNSGASLGVALLVMGLPGGFSASIPYVSGGLVLAAWTGAAAVLLLVAWAGRRLRNIMALLVLGLMLGSAADAIVQILQYFSGAESLKTYVLWTMGSLSGVTPEGLGVMTVAVVLGLAMAFACAKPLNQMLAGEQYAVSMGMNIRRVKIQVYLATILLCGTVTAFCGPISFIGLAVPHITRFLLHRSDHRLLLPATALAGALILLCCDAVSSVFCLPLNALTSLLGIPVVVWIVFKK